MSFTVILALICAFSWVSVSVSEFHTVEVQPGEEVTLLCSNFSKGPTHIFWFKLSERLNASCIVYMISSFSNASLCGGFKNDQFKMTSNTTNLFLNIKQVDLSASGLYFCGFYRDGHPVIVSATHLQVQDACNGLTNKLIIILGGGTILIITVIICLVVRIRISHATQTDKENPLNTETSSEALNYAAVRFHPKEKTSKRPVEERELETHVVYAAPHGPHTNDDPRSE
ncbi:unnamed protein product [Menidia menidia]|uniref:(Atlantic silverside) hypothetical protein n=1 Tax=Menidia menidia TaxID=238744 RepID=A0A8S4B4Y0_9TELE|nr:unnamed protein product [Menidia menidia]